MKKFPGFSYKTAKFLLKYRETCCIIKLNVNKYADRFIKIQNSAGQRAALKFWKGAEEKCHTKFFIDGEEGTTGLKINEYFRTRDNIELLHIDREKRKDPEERLRLIKKADVSFLCLPDAASREIAAAVPGECRILDTSTAHRTSPQWVLRNA